MDYDRCIHLMLRWRRIQKCILWAALGLPLVLFTGVAPWQMLVGWLLLVILSVISHHYRSFYRKQAHYAETNNSN
jgi:hypothetical protein